MLENPHLRFIGVLRDRLGELEDHFFATGLFRQRAFVPRHAVRLSRRGGRKTSSLTRQPRKVAGLGDVHLCG